MRRYRTKEDVRLGNFVAFDNRGKFYMGIPFEVLVGKVVKINEDETIAIKIDIYGNDVDVDIPYYMAQ